MQAGVSQVIKKPHFWLGVVLVLALFLRVFRLESAPASLYWEEAAIGYDAYSIYKTGKDYHGNPWPGVLELNKAA